jgi:crotonobetainyl-CoA hydratase
MSGGLKTAVSGDSGGVLEITIDRPKANAIDSPTSQALGEAFSAFRDDDALRVAILTGAGDRFFSAGWDMKAAVEGDLEDYGVGGFGGLTELFDLDKPVIAALNGMAVGGGFEIALACDLIVASRDAEMWLPEVHLGFVADAGGVLRLPQRLPRAIAMEMLLTGRRMTAEEALRWGVVNRVVDDGGHEDVLAAARELAAEVVSGAPLAVRATKAIVDSTADMSVEEAYAALRAGKIPQYDAVLASEDSEEGPNAFAEGRDPEWKGR